VARERPGLHEAGPWVETHVYDRVVAARLSDAALVA
jgi:hypothetical protein